MIRPSLAVAIVSGVVLCFGVADAHAQQVGSYEWTGAISGDWSDPGNWTLVDGEDASDGTAEAPLGNGIPGSLGARGEVVTFHAVGASNLNTFLTQSTTIGALHFNTNASSTIVVGGLRGDGASDDVTPIRLTFDSGTPPTDNYAVDILVPAGQHHVIQGEVQGSGSGNNALTFYGPQVWQIDDGASLQLDIRVRQLSNVDTSYTKTGNGLLILSQNNGGSGAWQFAGANNPIKAFVVADGTLRLAAPGARGLTSNSFLVEDGGTLQLIPNQSYGTNNGSLELHGQGHDGQGALHLMGGATTFAGGGSFNLASDATIRVDNDEAAGLIDVQQSVQGLGGLTKTGPGTLSLGGANAYAGDTSALDGTLRLGQASLADLADVFVSAGATIDLDFNGTDIIRSLYLAGVPGAVGTWGSLDSTADNKSELFTGLGVLEVTTLGTIAQAGDFNGDGNVDGADFVIWQTNFPNNTGTATLAAGDANGDGNVDGADFVVWQTNFPTTAGSATPVPEPAGIVFVLTACLALVVHRTRGLAALSR